VSPNAMATYNGETKGGKNWHFFLDLQTAMLGVWANTWS